MTTVKYTLEPLVKGERSIYLAGPSFRPGQTGVSWRQEAAALLHDFFRFDGTIIIPEHRDGKQTEGWTYSRQVSWELDGLREASVILFWIPRDLKELPAFTTNIEFGEWLASGKIVCGAPDEAPKMAYIRERCSRVGVPWSNTLRGCLENALSLLVQNRIQIWFTGDTHFGHERTRQLSKRPFKSVEEMDWAMVARWNSVVSKKDTVYHAGDFGNPAMLDHLNYGELQIIKGNYEDEETVAGLLSHPHVHVTKGGILYGEFGIVHEPKFEKTGWAEGIKFWLFGHIHKLQMVKKNGLNIGVDCHDFAPISQNTMLFYWNAILNHYDENVFVPEL